MEYRGSDAFEVAIRTQRGTGDRMIGWGLLIMPAANFPVSGLPLALPLPRGRDVVTIASALNPDGCDVIASLPSEGAAKPRPYQRPPCGGRGQHVVLSLPQGRLGRDEVPT